MSIFAGVVLLIQDEKLQLSDKQNWLFKPLFMCVVSLQC